MTQRAIFNGQEVDLPTAMVNLVFNTTHGESKYPGRVVIDPAAALQHYEWMDEVGGVTAALVRAVVHDWEGPVTKAALEKAQPSFRRLAGMLDMTVRSMATGVAFAWKYPEEGLHPMYQGNLADVMIALSHPPTLRGLLEKHTP